MGVSGNRGTPQSSIFIRFSNINQPFWSTPILGNLHNMRDNFLGHEWDNYITMGEEWTSNVIDWGSQWDTS